MMKKRTMLTLSGAGLAVLLLGTAFPAYASSQQSEQHAQKQHSNEPFQHVYVIMMENEGTAQLIGNSNLPYINSLVKDYGYADNYFGVTHESLANYVAFLSGSNWGTHSDDPTQTFDHTNLVDQLESHKLTWKGYMQSMPSVGYTGALYAPLGGGEYVSKHNPFQLMTDVSNNPLREKDIVPFTQLQTDLDSNQVPNFAFISPNLLNDMHGQPPYNQSQQSLFQQGDAFVKSTVEAIMNSKSWKTSKSIIYVAWDEAEYPPYGQTPTAAELQTFTQPGPDAPIVPAGTVDGYDWAGGPYGGGKVPLIMIDNADMHQFTIHTWSDHYSLLRTIEQNWNLGFLGNASDSLQVKTLPVPGEPK